MPAGLDFYFDRISHYLISGQGVRAVEVVVRDTTRESLHRLKPSPLASVAVAQVLAGAGLLSGHIKGEERLSVQLVGNGALGTILADVTADGNLRARVQYPAVLGRGESLAEKLSHAVGTGNIYVIKSTPTRELYRGAAHFSHSDVTGAIEHYLEQSEQVASAVWSSIVMADGQVEQARGLLLQALGGSDREAFEDFRGRLDRDQVQRALDAGIEVPSLLSQLFLGAAVQESEVRPLRFRCRCSEERVLAMLLSLGSAELKDMLEKDGQAEITCDFCMTRYTVGAPQLQQLLAMANRVAQENLPN